MTSDPQVPMSVPLRCTFCGERWTGSARMLGRTCGENPLVGSVDVVQDEPGLDPEEAF